MPPDPITYCGIAPTPLLLATRWNFDPPLLVGLALLLGGIALGKGDRRALVAGWVVLAIIFVSPLCALTVALFSARVVHHLLLVAVAMPLLAWGWRGVPGGRVPVGIAAVAHVAVFWFWHAPPPYAAALADPAVYWAMQASLAATALLFWRAVFDAQAQPLATTLALVGTVAQMGLLGAILAFAPEPLYAPHLATTAPWGLGPVTDQQLGGLIMWVAGAIPYGAALALLLRGWARGWRLAA
ncbi:cytochrome c oxidase assembly protein [Erythrobacteraceae bacterium CFH 75059]|uniref:cytochrome c oxidase assembly protein n=1 Tax=Qipengyuania thermophila TaxID=2509361 RepID=UPI00101F280C|nr:cytochrome c oxidase assembly protein [Qipengyuania thermophila]TCD06670.1 cytochrome c oxidase assembly protein [Erythrobacteraceae bacterium CFH 75059]